MLAAKLVTATAGGAPTPGLSWQSRFFRQDIYDVAWSSTLGLYAAVGQLGTVLTSPDGVTWTARTTTATVTLRGIVWTGSAFVASGSTTAIRSTDGITWTTTSTSMGTAYAIAYSPGSGSLPGAVVLSVGGSGGYRRSTNDGLTFSSGTISGAGTNYAVAWAPIGASSSLFAVASNSTIYTSPDGLTWTSQYTTTGQTFNSITWASGPNLFIAGTSAGAIFYSSNGTTWTNGLGLGTVTTVNRILYANSIYVAATDGGTIFTTTNPTSVAWTQRVFATPAALNALAWSGIEFVAMGIGAATYTSLAGTSWVLENTGTLYSLSGVAWGGGLFVAVGAAGQIVTSSDAATWTTRTSGTSNLLNAVAYSSALALYVAVGAGSTIIISSNGIIWSASGSTGYSDTLSAITWDGNAFWVVSSDSQRVFKSFDGANWNLATLQGADLSNRGIASDGVSGISGKLVIAEANDDVAYSINGGTSWAAVTSGVQQNNCVTYTGSVFLLVGSANLAVFTSPTGATWTSRTTPTTLDMYAAAAASSTNVVALGGVGTSKTSANALVSTDNSVTWAAATADPTARYRGVAYSPTLGRYVAVGQYGVVDISAPITGLVTTL